VVETTEEDPLATDRRAEVRWQGSLMDGSGTIVSTTTGAIGEQAVSWPARSTEETGGVTSPEELIAAAHASCFAMALSHALAQDGHTPEELRTSATVTFQPGEGITRIALTVDGRVPGVAEEGFRAAAQTAKENCPVSQALAGVAEITLEARLG
jgi:osmotically inducible protein OsmC